MTDHKYRPNVRFGLGGVSLGNEFEFVTDALAEQTLEAAWEAGVRYFDRRRGVDLHSAAMQFSAVPDLAAALVVGAASPDQVLENVTSMKTRIPSDFWDELRAEGLIEPTAPVPAETLELV